MPDAPLLTLKQIAESLALPESTVRYYRDAFPDRIPTVGTGRRRRYPQEAVEVLRSIAEAYASGHSRQQIATALGGTWDPQGGSARPAAGRTLDDVTNLDLLAAILDGEREQRDALWQMAKEIVRLSEVLEGQDRLLTEIAGQAGLPADDRAALAGRPRAALGAGEPEMADAAPGRIETMVPPVPPASAGADLARLREELEAERALVERLRQARLELERRAAEAEAQVESQRRSSVLRRIFRSDERP